MNLKWYYEEIEQLSMKLISLIIKPLYVDAKK